MEELSFSTKFQIHRDGIITGHDFVLGFFMMILDGFNTVQAWAATINVIRGNLVSAQGIQAKLQFRHEEFARGLLEHVLRTQLVGSKIASCGKGLLQSFGRVFLEDSTCVKLPSVLAAFFPGNFNHAGPGATARIQLRMELKTGLYSHLEVQSYRDNDQKFAGHIIDCLKKGDLIIRDLGYSVLAVFRKIMFKEAFFLSRFKYGVQVYDPETEQEIELLKKLKSLRHQGISVLDMKVSIGKKERLPVRLVAMEVPPQVAQNRRRKAEKDRNKKTNHSADYMEMLGWTIFITNVDEQTWTPNQMREVYGYRWHIEIIFKCWKSKFDFASLFDKKQTMTPSRAIITFYLLLTWLTLFFSPWYYRFLVMVYQRTGKWLSPLRFADFVKKRFEDICEADNLDQFVEHLARYYCYDKRKDKPNLVEKIYVLIFT